MLTKTTKTPTNVRENPAKGIHRNVTYKTETSLKTNE